MDRFRRAPSKNDSLADNTMADSGARVNGGGSRCTNRRQANQNAKRLCLRIRQRLLPLASTIIIWEEEDIEEGDEFVAKTDGGADQLRQRPKRRKLLWTNEDQHHLMMMDDESMMDQRQEQQESSSRKKRPRPHPLRTDIWKLTMHWRGRQRKKHYKDQTVLFEFSDNGYVRICNDDKHCRELDGSVVGKWTLEKNVLFWKLPLPMFVTDEWDASFSARVAINPFGDHPKLIRGVVLLEDPNKRFRPVVATFTGVGIGEDKADLSYSDRLI